MKRIIFLSVLALAIATAASAQTKRFYVKAGATGNGSSWTDASGNLQAMINDLANVYVVGAEIWVAAGTYKPQYTASGYEGRDFQTRNCPTTDGAAKMPLYSGTA
jgi:opacity protein-like surface antigen